MKLSRNKSSRLLQRIAFLVFFLQLVLKNCSIWVCSLQYLFYHLFYVWQIWFLFQNNNLGAKLSPRCHKHLKGHELVHKVFIKIWLKTIVTLIFIFVWEFTAFLITAKDIFTSQRLNCSIDISVKKFAKKLSSSSFGSYLLGVKVFIFFLGLLECFDILSSLYILDIVWFCRFCLSSNFEKDFEYFPLSISNLMLVRSLTPFACLFSNR